MFVFKCTRENMNITNQQKLIFDFCLSDAMKANSQTKTKPLEYNVSQTSQFILNDPNQESIFEYEPKK